MKQRKFVRMFGGVLVAVGMILGPLPAYSATQCEKMNDDQLRAALNQELAALENDHSEEDDAALDRDILTALKNGHLVDYKDLEATMADDGTTVEDVVEQAVEEADEADAPKDAPQAQGQGAGMLTRVSRRGVASRADGATDAVKELVEKADEARAKAK